MKASIKQIRETISLSHVLQRDGHHLRRVGARCAALCPFHQERTPSFFVFLGNDGLERFKCFGCGKGGDIIDYWGFSRSTDTANTIASLVSLASVACIEPSRKPEIQEKVLKDKPMSECVASVWREGLEWLADSKEEQERISRWRGWRTDTVSRMVHLGLMGMPLYAGKRSEAFPVLLPSQEETVSRQAGFHVHAPHLKGRFRFVPEGIGSWPFVIGNITQCKVLIILEGQWDAISFYDALSDGVNFPEGVAVAGVRGSATWSKLLAYEWDHAVQAFIFAHGDDAGWRWLEADSLCGAMRLRCKAVHPFLFTQNQDGVKDFNDVHRTYHTTSQDWYAMLRSWCEKGSRKGRRC